MFCKFCGKDMGETSALFCPFCGSKQDITNEAVLNNQQLRDNNNGNNSFNIAQRDGIQQDVKKTKVLPKWLDKILLIVAAIVILIIFFSVWLKDDKKNPEDVQPAGNTVDKLAEFTTAYEMENGNIALLYEGDGKDHDWCIRLTDISSAISIYDDVVARIFIDYEGIDAFRGDYCFIYVPSEERVSVYLDESLYGASIVSYMLADDEIILNVEANHYSPSKEFEKYMRDSGVFEIMKQDIDEVGGILKNHGITFSDTSILRKNNIQIINKEDSITKADSEKETLQVKKATPTATIAPTPTNPSTPTPLPDLAIVEGGVEDFLGSYTGYQDGYNVYVTKDGNTYVFHNRTMAETSEWRYYGTYDKTKKAVFFYKYELEESGWDNFGNYSSTITKKGDCSGYMYTYGDGVLYVVFNKKDFDPDDAYVVCFRESY